LTGALTILLLACSPRGGLDTSTTSTATVPRGDCNPVEDSGCMLPFPSDFYMEDDPGTGTGLRVHFGPSSLPMNIDDVQMAPDFWNELDGFSTLGELLAHLPGATLDGVIGWQDLGAYADADARTVVVDTQTGERAVHWVERDVFSDDPDRELLVLRPAAPLKHATRYVVGIRGLVDSDGALVDAPQGFAALRDGTATDDPDLERQRDHYETVVFPTLEAAGFVQLAWSFTTTSKDGSLGRALWMRDDALAWAADQGMSYTIDSLAETDCTTGANIGRDITGTVAVPLYLESAEPGSLLTRDADGWPYRNGTVDVPFTARVPCSVIAAAAPAPILQFGHSLLASQSEVGGSNIGEIANQTGAVLLAVDWWGMSEQDRKAVALMVVNQTDQFSMIPERLMQSFVNAQIAARTLDGPMGSDPAFSVDGQTLIDPDQTWFYGVSQGGILGGGFGAYSRDITRLVLAVPGTPFTLLLARSSGFAPFLIILQTMFEDPADVSVIIGLMQSVWDPGEAAGYARFMTQEPLDALTADKQVLLLAGLGDGLVTDLGAHIMARSYGATLIAPTVQDVYGVQSAKPPFTGSAFMEEDWGVEDPVEAVPAEGDVEVHNVVPWTDAAMALVEHWLVTGEAITTCKGVCDPD